jgi:DNA segregation ATPase FtsK/SpoIIIE-like protein
LNNFEGKREVTGIALFFCAIALTLLYYLPSEVTGVFGSFLKTVCGGFIGSAAFMIPLFILYASIDFFIEKREGVSPIRIRSVIIFLICLSALLSVITMDFIYFKSLCASDVDHKYKATQAIALLWKSGADPALISQDPNSSVLSGGILGGLLAVALHTVCGKITSIVVLIGLIAAQIILVFHISLKKTVKKTARAVGNAVKKSSERRAAQRPAVQHLPQGQRPVQQYSNPFVQGQTRPLNNPAANAYGSSPFVNAPVRIGPQPVFDKSSYNVQDPFNRSLPVDSKSGFADMSDPAFAADTQGEQGVLKYGEKRVSTEKTYNTEEADFSYDSMPRAAHIRGQGKKADEPDFLKMNAQKDFYDLSGGVYADESSFGDDFSQQPGAGGYYTPEDDMPYEINDDTAYDFSGSANTRKVRTPNIPVAPVVPAPAPAPASDGITINASSDNTDGYSVTEGRIIDTSEARKASAAGSLDVSSTSAQTEGRRIKANAYKNYRPAPISTLAKDKTNKNTTESNEKLKQKAAALEETLRTFGITDAKVNNITHGPAITRFEVTIGQGVKVSKVKNLEDDIALAMAATAVRIEAPIPGKKAIGIEIPNEKTSAVYLGNVLDTPEFKKSSPLTVGLGKDIPGKPVYCDVAKMPHMLIAGATGSGKSVCINSILISILCKASPKDVKMILIDPKVVELSVYNGIPHLLMPVVSDMKLATGALKWAVAEMERRYKLFAEKEVRDIAGYNNCIDDDEEPLPLILIIIDELADLMAVAKNEVETQIARLAAMARACGMHMIIATQRPSVDVITGVIKSNVPSRIAFSVASGVDSRTILDSQGAEKLLGRGDMLYSPLGAPKPIRGQGAFVSDGEVQQCVDFLKQRYGALYDQDINDKIQKIANGEGTGKTEGVSDPSVNENSEDELLNAAVDVVLQVKNASVSILQRRLGVGYPRAARLIDVMEQKGYIGPFEGSKPRRVLISETDWIEIKAKGGNG